MKAKILLLFLMVFAIACTPKPVVTPTFVPTITQVMVTPSPTLLRTAIPTTVFSTDFALINAFKPSETCPNICWMGIHAGTTLTSQAVMLLKNRRGMKQFEIFGNTIFSSSDEFHALLAYSKDTIESIQVTNLSSLTVGEMMSILGEPESLQLNNRCLDRFINFRCLYYALYYPSLNVVLYLTPSSRMGPDPNDHVDTININLPFELVDPLQLWLGYGHADQYMQNVPLPTPTPYLVGNIAWLQVAGK